jgi:DnaJ-class molecular chaperone
MQWQRRHAENRAGQNRIPAGVDTGSRVRIPKKGHGGRFGGGTGRFVYYHQCRQTSFFTRKGDNIYVQCRLPFPKQRSARKSKCRPSRQSAIEDSGGNRVRAKFQMRERGFPSLRNPNLRGDQFIEVQISLPRVISEETKEILREFEKANPENPARRWDWNKLQKVPIVAESRKPILLFYSQTI